MNQISSPDYQLDRFGHFFKRKSGDRLTLAQRRLGQTIQKGLEVVEAQLVSDLSFTDMIADTSARYLLEAGGKRVRPALVLLTAQLGDGITEDVIRAAKVIEVTHLATLYHDDVMDEAELRRGVVAAQKVWGNSVAILAGDLLFSRANRILLELGLEALELQSDTFERLCIGQLNETIGPKEGDDPVQHYLQVLSDKTGSLLGAAAQFGLRFSKGNLEFEEALIQYGENVGIAFQLADDVIDISDQSEKTGKDAGTDLRSGVDTMPILKLRSLAETDRGAKDLLHRLTQTENTETFEAALEELRNHRVVEETVAEAKKYAELAIAAIRDLPEGDVKKSLETFAKNMAEREG